jgi:hypothetical protein
MNEINSVLNDESNNDKELIKELSVYVKNHRDKKMPINKKFFKDVINICLKNSEIAFDEIEFNDSKDSLAEWAEDKRLGFNVTSILNSAKDSKRDWLSNAGNNRLFAYYIVLETIIHELTHARQYYVEETEGNNIYSSCLNFIYENYGIYWTHHDDILIERYADLRGSKIAYQVLSYIYPEKQIRELRDIQIECLLDGYKIVHDGYLIPLIKENEIYSDSEIISALDNYNGLMEDCSLPKVNIDITDDMTLYDRLYLGLPISASEYYNLSCLYYNMHHDKKAENVKTLINRL